MDEREIEANTRRFADAVGVTMEEATAGISAGGKLWTTAQAAEHCGVKPKTYTYYVLRQGAPAAVSRQPGRGGQDLFDAEAVRAWHANRPGHGARTDLRARPDSS